MILRIIERHGWEWLVCVGVKCLIFAQKLDMIWQGVGSCNDNILYFLINAVIVGQFRSVVIS